MGVAVSNNISRLPFKPQPGLRLIVTFLQPRPIPRKRVDGTVVSVAVIKISPLPFEAFKPHPRPAPKRQPQRLRLIPQLCVHPNKRVDAV